MQQNSKNIVTGWLDSSLYTNYHVNLGHLFGLEESIILSKLVTLYNYYSKRGELGEGGRFYVTVPDMQRNTAIKEAAQRRAIKNLKKADLLDSFQKGLPAKRYFILYFDNIAAAMERAGEYNPDSKIKSKNLQNGGTGSGAVLEQENAQEPHNGQNLQNGGTRTAETTEPEPPFPQRKRIELKELDIKQSNIKINPNPYPQNIDIYRLSIPHELKVFFKDQGRGLAWGESELYDLQAFYNLAQPLYIQPNCSPEDYEHLNDFEFCFMLKKIYREVKGPIRTMQGLLNTWIQDELKYKRSRVMGEHIQLSEKEVPEGHVLNQLFNY